MFDQWRSLGHACQTPNILGLRLAFRFGVIPPGQTVRGTANIDADTVQDDHDFHEHKANEHYQEEPNLDCVIRLTKK